MDRLNEFEDRTGFRQVTARNRMETGAEAPQKSISTMEKPIGVHRPRIRTVSRKCAVIGCGFVGATTAFSLMQSELFSSMVLIDIDFRKAEGEAADLSHGLPFHAPMEIYAGDYDDLVDASLIIITAGVGQKPGETRLDLLENNTRIFRSILKEITKYNSDAILLVVTNPVDLLTYKTIEFSGFPPHRVIGSGTVLDTARLKYLVGRELGVDFRNVHTFIIGEHGDSELPVWSSANISGVDLDHYCGSCVDGPGSARLHELFDNVRTSAYHIIEAKGATYYAIAESVRRIAEAIVRDEDTILPVSTLLTGEYGLYDICLSLPSVVGTNGIHQVLEIPLDASEMKLLRRSAETLREMLHSTGRS